MPGDVSSTIFRIGRRRVVYMQSPTPGMILTSVARVCSIDMNSRRSWRTNAHVSTTCSPWVLMTFTVCPRCTNAAHPRRAGMV